MTMGPNTLHISKGLSEGADGLALSAAVLAEASAGQALAAALRAWLDAGSPDALTGPGGQYVNPDATAPTAVALIAANAAYTAAREAAWRAAGLTGGEAA